MTHELSPRRRADSGSLTGVLAVLFEAASGIGIVDSLLAVKLACLEICARVHLSRRVIHGVRSAAHVTA
eukprot:7378839-Prymnesium_polylepis.1